MSASPSLPPLSQRKPSRRSSIEEMSLGPPSITTPAASRRPRGNTGLTPNPSSASLGLAASPVAVTPTTVAPRGLLASSALPGSSKALDFAGQQQQRGGSPPQQQQPSSATKSLVATRQRSSTALTKSSPVPSSHGRAQAFPVTAAVSGQPSGAQLTAEELRRMEEDGPTDIEYSTNTSSSSSTTSSGPLAEARRRLGTAVSEGALNVEMIAMEDIVHVDEDTKREVLVPRRPNSVYIKRRRNFNEVTLPETQPAAAPQPNLLGQLAATCLAGNDLLGSIFYTIGAVIAVCGVYAPLALIIVSAALWLLKSILTEAGMLIPKSSGTYQVIVNASRPLPAMIAGVCSAICYITTAVVSAASMATYTAAETDKVDAFWLTIVVIVAIALINLAGLKESTAVATAVFVSHMLIVGLLMGMCVYRIVQRGTGVLRDNYHATHVVSGSKITEEVFLAYCLGMLGATGFETSSNYITETKRAAFPKTLRNLWVLVTITNPVLSLLAVMMMPLETYKSAPGLAITNLAESAGGRWLRILLVVDACAVLIGGVLTAFIGVIGIVDRLARDKYLPAWLLKRHPRTGAPNAIVIGFGALCIMLYLLVNGNLSLLGGVFAIAFLAVMAWFTIGTALLKLRRTRMIREFSASWFSVVVSMFALLAAFLGNIILTPIILVHFLIVFSICGCLVLFTIYRRSFTVMYQRLRRSGHLLPKQMDRSGSIDHSLASMGSQDEIVRYHKHRNRRNSITNQHLLDEMFSAPSVSDTSENTSYYSSSSEDSDRRIVKRHEEDRPNILKLVGLHRERDPVIFLLSHPDVVRLTRAMTYCSDYVDASIVYIVHFCGTEHTASRPCRIQAMWYMLHKTIRLQYPKMQIELVQVHANFTPHNVKIIAKILSVKVNFVFLRAPGANFCDGKYGLGDFDDMRMVC
jgi:amino acid transporter